VEAIGPKCPACGAKVKLPAGKPLPPPSAKVKCPTCETVGELEAFIRAAAGVADSGAGAFSDGEDSPAAETMPNLPVSKQAQPEALEIPEAPEAPAAGETTSPAGAPPSASSDLDGGTRISGRASELHLPPGIRCALTVLSGPDGGRKLEMRSPRVVVGRESGDLPLSDKEVSREHCAFEIAGVTCTVRDLGSRNGTFVDGRRIGSEILSNMGEVTLGNTTLLFTITLEESIQGE